MLTELQTSSNETIQCNIYFKVNYPHNYKKKRKKKEMVLVFAISAKSDFNKKETFYLNYLD